MTSRAGTFLLAVDGVDNLRPPHAGPRQSQNRGFEPAVILTAALAQPLQDPLRLGSAAGEFSSCPGQSDPAVRPPTRRRRWAPPRSLLTVTSAQVRCSSDDFASALSRCGQGVVAEWRPAVTGWSREEVAAPDR
jgi:hypothetical protein